MQSGDQKVFVVNTILLGYLRLITRLYTNTPPAPFLRENSISKFSLGMHTDLQPDLSQPTRGAKAGLDVHQLLCHLIAQCCLVLGGIKLYTACAEGQKLWRESQEKPQSAQKNTQSCFSCQYDTSFSKSKSSQK